MQKNNPITYSDVGDNYATKDPVKKLAQESAKETAGNLIKHGFKEISETRGESAFVWEQNGFYLASVIEGLGTKNLVADEMRKVTNKTYYDVIGHDTVTTIINDLIAVGATPLVIHAYWAIEDNGWIADKLRMSDFIRGWKEGCDKAGVVWGGGETPTLKGVVVPHAVDLAGSAVGIIKDKSRLITDTKLREGDKILLLKSSGINCNGVSLARAVAKKLPHGFGTIISGERTFGEEVLNKTNIYASLFEDLFNARIDVHYLANITGHGLRKLMRARQNYTYVIEEVVAPQEVFTFMQKQANLSDFEMYQTFNMGMDYAIFLPDKDVKKAQEVVAQSGFTSLEAGYVEKGKRQVIIKPKKIVFKAGSLDLR